MNVRRFAEAFRAASGSLWTEAPIIIRLGTDDYREVDRVSKYGGRCIIHPGKPFDVKAFQPKSFLDREPQ